MDHSEPEYSCADTNEFQMVMLFCIVASGTVTNFFPTVVATLGYGNIVSLLLTAPPYVLCVITAFINAWHADRTGERYFHITLPLWVCVAAFIIAASTTATGPRYFAMMLMVPSVYTGYVVALAWISNTLPRPPAKRAAALAWINAVSNTSSIYASYSKFSSSSIPILISVDRTETNRVCHIVYTSGSPRFVVAMSVNCVTAFIAICMATLLRFILVRLNKQLDAGMPVEGAINDVDEHGIPTGGGRHGFRFKV
jgi:MFS family permease